MKPMALKVPALNLNSGRYLALAFAGAACATVAPLDRGPTTREFLTRALDHAPMAASDRAALVSAMRGPERLIAASAFVRMKPEGNVQMVADALERATSDKSAEVRAVAIRALGIWGPEREPVFLRALAEPAVGVRVQAVRALAQNNPAAVGGHLAKESSHAVLLAGLEALAGKPVSPPSVLLHHVERAIRCAAEVLTEKVAPDCLPRQRVSVAKDEATLRLLWRELPLRSAVAERAAELALTGFLQEMLATGDAGVIAAAAEGLKNDPEAVPLLIELLPKLHSADAVEAMIGVIDVLGANRDKRAVSVLSGALLDPNVTVREHAIAALKGMDVTAPVVTPAPSPVAPGNAQEAQTRQLRAIIETPRGRFAIELLGRDAPHTVASFVYLARKSFFDGLTFHRVVPDFVVQGGDPRGDGYGGPGYTLRCELNGVHYERGTVGMALAGRDTGGSQWFVTLSPQPHLDGRYTAFGRVIEGMNVVDALLPGDRILSVRILPAN